MKSERRNEQLPPGIGDVYGPAYGGNLQYGDRKTIPTNYGNVGINSETKWRFWNGAKQEIIGGHWEARCPCCYQNHKVEGTTDEKRAELWNVILDCCDEVRWLPPSDYLDPCDVCGDSHREQHECTAPAHRDPLPHADDPAECTDCGWSVDHAEDIPVHDGSCPECGSNAVRIGGDSDE